MSGGAKVYGPTTRSGGSMRRGKVRGEECKENSSWGGVGARRLAIEMRPQSEKVWCAVSYVGRCGLAPMRLEAYTLRVYRSCRERGR